MRKETVGILTFHQAYNYGAVLQAYALKAVCEELGYDAKIIDYSYRGISENVAPFAEFIASKNKKSAFIKLVRNLMSYPGDKVRKQEFVSFRKKYLDESAKCTTAEDIKKLNYDILISGSDQIWNYKITGGAFDPVFFLNIDTAAKKIIYAASSQDVPFPLNMELKFKKYFKEDDISIGIREKKLADYVADITQNKYPVVLDPTLLAGKKILSDIPTPEPPRNPYILIYQIDANPASDVSVKNLERRFGCNVYTMTVPRLGSMHGRKGDCGPEKFLSLLKGAKFLVTNSFHGIALSLIFEKQFYVYENGGVMSRIDGLLEQTQLLDRKIKFVNQIDTEKVIDYDKVTPILKGLQKESMTFLSQALKEGVPKTVVSSNNEIKPIISMEQRQKGDCCGCSACLDICPVKAISMKADEEGFFYPAIDKSKCIHCGKCDRVCGFKKIKKREKPFELPQAYGIKHKDLNVRESSRSGAAFIGFSDVILQNEGVVYGAAMQQDFSVKHIRATTFAQRDQMKKAKYVQSSTSDIYPSVEKDLKTGLKVLFSGTPCQVAGLKAYLVERKIDTTNLFCCDIVCHGVPSPTVWQDYIKHIEKKYKRKVIEANFRDKDFGWDSHCETFKLQDYDKKKVEVDYTNLFYQHIMLRPSCHNCKFANVYRPGDITLADFWGIEKHDSSFNDNRGISLVLVNTQKGKDLFEEALDDFDYFKTKVENCMQPTLFKPSSPSPRREQFWQDYQVMQFDDLLKKYTKPLSVYGKLKKQIKLIMYYLRIKKHP